MRANSQKAKLLRALTPWLEGHELAVIDGQSKGETIIELKQQDAKLIEGVRTVLNRLRRPFTFRFDKGVPRFEVQERTMRDFEDRRYAMLKRRPNDDMLYDHPSRYGKIQL